MVDGSLISSLIAAHSREVELPLRCSGPLGAVAADILRYGACIGSVVEHHPVLGRTMTAAREMIGCREAAGRSVESGTVIVADELQGARGRFVRTWHAPLGGLWGCVVVVNTLLPPARQLLPLAVGVAGCEAIARAGGPAVIRWINDVLIDGRKVAGFLCESFGGQRSGEEYCLIGFGINVNNETFPEELEDRATSVSAAVGKQVDLQAFACDFFGALRFNVGLLHYVEQAQLQEDLPPGRPHLLLERWRQLSDSIGRRVVYGFDVETKPQYRAATTDIADDGGLCLTLEAGGSLIEHSGEIRYLD